MNKIIFFIISSVMVVGCNPESNTIDDKSVKRTGWWHLLREITIDGKTHEYLQYDRGICHYPECKYCKETK